MKHFPKFILNAKGLFWFLMVLTACTLSTRAITSHSSAIPIYGQIMIKEGNCMPGPKSPPCKFYGKKASLLICKPSKSYLIENLIQKIETNEDGHFNTEIADGTYSLFVDYQNNIHCPTTICNAECHCMPITIKTAKRDSIVVELDLAVY